MKGPVVRCSYLGRDIPQGSGVTCSHLKEDIPPGPGVTYSYGEGEIPKLFRVSCSHRKGDIPQVPWVRCIIFPSCKEGLRQGAAMDVRGYPKFLVLGVPMENGSYLDGP